MRICTYEQRTIGQEAVCITVTDHAFAYVETVRGGARRIEEQQTTGVPEQWTGGRRWKTTWHLSRQPDFPHRTRLPRGCEGSH